MKLTCLCDSRVGSLLSIARMVGQTMMTSQLPGVSLVVAGDCFPLLAPSGQEVVEIVGGLGRWPCSVLVLVQCGGASGYFF